MSIVNGLMNTKSTGDVTALVGELARKVDTNRDGQVSTTEFAQFLTQLIGQQTQPGGASPLGGSSRSADVPAVPPPTMRGWDAAKWADPTHVTPKYVIGRILAGFAPTPQGLMDALPDIQRAIPGTTLVGDDKLDIPGVGAVDVGLSFSVGGGVGWWWGQE
jgi:hypothetical protein